MIKYPLPAMNPSIETLQVSILSVWLQTRHNFGRDGNQATVRKLIADWFELAKQNALLPDGETAKYKGQLASSEEVRTQHALRIAELEQEIERVKSGDRAPEIQELQARIAELEGQLERTRREFRDNFPGLTIEDLKELSRKLESIQRLVGSH